MATTTTKTTVKTSTAKKSNNAVKTTAVKVAKTTAEKLPVETAVKVDKITAYKFSKTDIDYNSMNSDIKVATKLNVINQNKELITTLKDDNKTLYKDTIKLLNTRINELRKENSIYEKANKKTLAKLLKTRYDSKDKVINVVLNLIILGLNVDNSLSVSTLEKTVKFVNKGLISKNFVNKSDAETLKKELAKITKEELIKRLTSK